VTARILVIEDNPTNLDLMCYLLRAFGYAPLTASDGEEGLEVAQREQPDLILCDIQMPRLSGFEVVRRLKNHPALSQIPLVAVTASAMVGDSDKVLAAGFDGYIAKPITPETFVEQVARYLPSDRRASPLPSSEISGTIDPVFVLSMTGHWRILVVDDNPVNLTLKQRILEPMGSIVGTASGMEDALALARQTPPDLIISDVNMPGGSGLAFIGKVKADPLLCSIPFIFITSTAQDERSRDADLALGADRFLYRPLEPQAFLAKIKACLRKQEDF
jgi:two-component system, cell cycle response regulator